MKSIASPILILALCTLVSSCAPSGANVRDGDSPPARTGPKRLVAAIQSNPSTLTNILVVSSGQPGVPEMEEMVHQGLTDADPEGLRHAMLAEAVPSLENGHWQLLPDGGMTTTWTI